MLYRYGPARTVVVSNKPPPPNPPPPSFCCPVCVIVIFVAVGVIRVVAEIRTRPGFVAKVQAKLCQRARECAPLKEFIFVLWWPGIIFHAYARAMAQPEAEPPHTNVATRMQRTQPQRQRLACDMLHTPRRGMQARSRTHAQKMSARIKRFGMRIVLKDVKLESFLFMCVGAGVASLSVQRDRNRVCTIVCTMRIAQQRSAYIVRKFRP